MPTGSGARDPRAKRAMAAAVVLFYVALFVALIWPVYPRFAGIEPRVLGVPFSLAYVVAALLVSFVVLLAYHAWTGRSENDRRRPPPAPTRRMAPPTPRDEG